MALLFELLLTAAVTLLAAFLLATFFAANDPRREPGRAAAITEEEERIIEVDEVTRSERRAAAVPAPEAEGWVEVDKAPAVVVEEEVVVEDEPECAPEPEDEGVPLKSARAATPGAAVEEKVGARDERCDLTAAAPATGHVLVAEAVYRVVPDVVGRVEDVGAKHHELGAEAAPSQVPDAQPEEKQAVQAAEEIPAKLEAFESDQQHPTKLKAFEPEQHHLVSEVAPAAAEVIDIDAGMEESVQATIEVRPCELAVSSTASEEIPDVVFEKKAEQTVEAKGNELAADSVPQAALTDVPLPEEEVEEELEVQQPVEETVCTPEEVQSREEAKCETRSFNQQEALVPEEELVATKSAAAEVSHEDSSIGEVVTELPVEVVTLRGPPEDDAEADMDFGEWEGIERSEVEKRFGAAAAFAASEAGAAALSKLNSDVQLQLQGLLKVAIDGPCYDSVQPLTLRPSSRAKWVAWQKLGNMHPEIAMEKYMNLLSEVIPGWLRNETADTKKHETGDYSVGTILTMAATSDQQGHRGNEESTSTDEGHLTASPNPEKGQSSNIPAE